jgi:SPP1 gp7 family putative phage head morphogenesis protein
MKLRARPSHKAAIEYTRRSSGQYARQLRRIANHIGDLAKSVDPNDPASIAMFDDLMARYSRTLEPWAQREAQRIALEINMRDTKHWFNYARQMGSALRQQIENAPIGNLLMDIRRRQVDLITSLPTRAAERINQIATGAIYSGLRPEALAKEVHKQGDVSRAIANTIARTEISTATTEFTKIRSQSIGSEGYIWRTVGDARVRDTHQHMEGKFIRWDDPPMPDGPKNGRYHAGCIYNCRCIPEPVLPDEEFFRREARDKAWLVRASNSKGHLARGKR